MRLAVQPAHKGGFVPPHPQDGEMPPEGAEWLADQHTLCLLRDGVLKRTPEKVERKAQAQPVAKPAGAKPKAKAATVIPAQAIEQPQREIVDAIKAAFAPNPDPATDPAPGAGDAV